MLSNLVRRIPGFAAFLALGMCAASQTTVAANLADFPPYGVYALAAQPSKNFRRVIDLDHVGVVLRDVPVAAGAASKLAGEPSENPRQVIEYDSPGHVAEVMTIPPWGGNNGLKIVAYFPGTEQKRMEAIGDWWATTATYYRQDDGTRDCVLKVSSGAMIVDWYSKTGELTLEQFFFDEIQGTDRGLSQPKHQYVLYDVIQMDARGNPLREYTVFPGSDVAQIDTQHGEKIAGDYHLFMYGDDQMLTLETYGPKEGAFPTTRIEHTAAEGKRAPHVAAELLRWSPHVNEDAVPAPPIYDEYR